MREQHFIFGFFLFLLISCKPESIVTDINSKYSNNLLIENGGRVSWYQGNLHSKILFDRITKSIGANTDVYIMEPDGTGIECLTCNIDDITNKFTGQPVWHPDGVHCVIQVENSNSKHTRFEHVSFGFNNDLWILNTNTREAQKIFTSDKNHAALHPQFNTQGDKLIFSKRIPTGNVNPLLIGITPGGENQWAGWQIQINDFDISKSGSQMISNSQLIKPNGNGFYETHAIDTDITYSFTANGKAFVDDCFTADLNGQNPKNLINNPNQWEEHATFSPSGNHFIFISSRHDNSWSYPDSDARTISTELYMKNNHDNSMEQLTNLNLIQKDFRILTSDFDWNKEGDEIIFLVAKIHDKNPLLTTNEIWKMEFDSKK